MEKLKWACDQSFERDRAHGFSWPQRNYRCSFCKKEFKSAQALGGHMNVHRRDRARLRLSSPPPPESPYQNPNPVPTPNPSFSCLKPMFLGPACNNNAASFGGGVGDSSRGAVVGGSVERLSSACGVDGGSSQRGKKNKVGRVWKANEVIVLDLNLGLVHQDHDVKEEDHLDLELRLGFSN